MEKVITGNTKLYGLIGKPVKHSRSPEMQNYAFEHHDIDSVYLVFEVDDTNLESAIHGLKSLGVLGYNITMPIKQSIIPLLDELSQEAEIIGAVNTVINQKGKLTGYNTDGQGFVQSLVMEGIEPKEKVYSILGGGGAAKAIAVQLAIEGAKEIRVFSRNLSQGESIKNSILNHIDGVVVDNYSLDMELLKQKCTDSDVLIQTTGVGMGEYEGQSVVTDLSVFHENLIAVDVIYHPAETKFMQMAKTAGCKKIINGLGMMIGQGAIAFKIWTDQEMPVELVKRHLGFSTAGK